MFTLKIFSGEIKLTLKVCLTFGRFQKNQIFDNDNSLHCHKFMCKQRNEHRAGMQFSSLKVSKLLFYKLFTQALVITNYLNGLEGNRTITTFLV